MSEKIEKLMREKENKEESIEGIRPKTFDRYIGQEKIKKIVSVYIKAAKERNEPLDHMLFYGPRGLGKTTIACIIANEMGKNIKIITGPNLEKPCDIISVLSNIEDGDIVFIDEIHRVNRTVEEVLYPAMEDFAIDVKVGEGRGQKCIRIDLPKFTLIGATTRVGMLTAPLRDRFGLINKMEYYTVEELSQIVQNTANILGVEIDEEAKTEIAKRSRGTPRLANRLLKQIRNFAQVQYNNKITKTVVDEVLKFIGIDDCGLDENDMQYLRTIIKLGDGKPVGLNALASAMNEDIRTIEDVYEPYLLSMGLINRTPKGRILTETAKEIFR